MVSTVSSPMQLSIASSQWLSQSSGSSSTRVFADLRLEFDNDIFCLQLYGQQVSQFQIGKDEGRSKYTLQLTEDFTTKLTFI